jgi:hypothetical protein
VSYNTTYVSSISGIHACQSWVKQSTLHTVRWTAVPESQRQLPSTEMFLSNPESRESNGIIKESAATADPLKGTQGTLQQAQSAQRDANVLDFAADRAHSRFTSVGWWVPCRHWLLRCC